MDISEDISKVDGSSLMSSLLARGKGGTGGTERPTRAQEQAAARGLANKHMPLCVVEMPKNGEVKNLIYTEDGGRGSRGGPIPPKPHELAQVVEEKPEYKFVLYLKATGVTEVMIAKQTGYSLTLVYSILAQPWARQQVMKLVETTDTPTLIAQMLQNAAPMAIRCLIDLASDDKVNVGVRLKAAQDILDRQLGKAAVTVRMTAPRQVSDDDAAIDAELERLQAHERDLIGRPKLRQVNSVIDVG